LPEDSANVRNAPPWRRPAGKIIVVLPAYNEQDCLGELLEGIDQVMFDDDQRYRVIVVDDGSSDATCAEAERRAVSMPIQIERHESNQGLGASIRDGLRIAASACGERDVVVVMDADNTHAPGLVRAMNRRVQEGADVVIASRFRSGASVRGVPLHRRLLSHGASWLLRLLFPVPGVRDYTCGYRAYRGTVLKRAFDSYGDEFVDQEGFQCMVDILLKLRRMNLVFSEVSMILRYDRKSGKSKMAVGQTIVSTLGLIVRRRLGR
jgi:dolichol-phosphate mannosyltransferase